MRGLTDSCVGVRWRNVCDGDGDGIGGPVARGIRHIQRHRVYARRRKRVIWRE
jgi:hypothetical protein